MRRRLPTSERRALIVDAAGRLFGERGFDGTRLEDVATAAGVTKPILYRHFADKERLYLALLERHRDDLSSFAIPSEGTLEERLRSVLETWTAYVETHAYAWRMLFRDTGGGPAIQGFRADVHARARAVLGGMIRSFGVRIPESELAPTAELMSMGMASLILWWMDEPGVSRQAVVNSMTRIWAGLLGGDDLAGPRQS
jgi:AcrR family transcriptional regulator